MTGCASGCCGREAMDEPDAGLEQRADGKWTCTMCYINTVRFQQPNFKKPKPEPQGPELKDKELFSG